MPRSATLSLALTVEDQPLRQPFTITGYVFEKMPAAVVRLSDGVHVGRGEAAGVYYLGDDIDHVVATIESVRAQVEAGITRDELLRLLPPGGARNAIDCALWELEAAQAGQPVYRVAGMERIRPLITTLTAGADTPEAMAAVCLAFDNAKALKLKLTGEPALDIARVRAVRAACPDAWLGVDANQGYTLVNLVSVIPAFQEQDVALIEQPLKRGAEDELLGLNSPIPLAADESVLSLGDVENMVGRFDAINIKLDKCGGLTEGLTMAAKARSLGLDVMVGNMGGSSWAMGPAFVLGQLCDIVDLDGPITLRQDRDPAVSYDDGLIWCGDDVWGRGVAMAMPDLG